jgi:hypothetical protein
MKLNSCRSFRDPGVFWGRGNLTIENKIAAISSLLPKKYWDSVAMTVYKISFNHLQIRMQQ